jgi:hypothetical protein
MGRSVLRPYVIEAMAAARQDAVAGRSKPRPYKILRTEGRTVEAPPTPIAFSVMFESGCCGG